jgi:hypothetical protein
MQPALLKLLSSVEHSLEPPATEKTSLEFVAYMIREEEMLGSELHGLSYVWHHSQMVPLFDFWQFR